jgi:uncharacterized protein (DUF1501 family)
MRDCLSTRRVFLQRGLTLLAAAPTVPAFLDQTVMAMASPLDAPLTQQPSGKDGKVLVVVQMAGGNDGLNTVVPFADDTYHRVRPGIRHDPRTLHKLSDTLGLHPNLRPLTDLNERGQMTIVQAVGYPNPNRSHFRATDIWESAQPEREQPSSGWVGRYFDNACAGADPHVGVNVGDTLPLAMQGERVTPLTLERPESYRYRGPDRVRYEELNRIGKKSEDGRPRMEDGRKVSAPSSVPHSPSSTTLDFLHRTAMDAQLSSDDILRVAQNHQPPGEYPKGELGEGLRLVAAMIRGGMSTRVYYVRLGGFDTHANERGRHDQLMLRFGEAVGAFWADLKSQKNDERVLMMTFSEFGRRVAQNASGGTDHGAAAPLFLFGPRVKGGVVGNNPSLTDLDNGDVKHQFDFRSVYATVLHQWLDTPSKPVLGQQFKLLPILKA